MTTLDLSKIGPSDYPQLIGADPYGSLFGLYARTKLGIERSAPAIVEEAAAWGHLIEPLAARAFCLKRLGCDPDAGEIQLFKPPTRYPPGRPHSRVSLDFLAIDVGREDRHGYVIECKLISKSRFDREGWGEDESGDVPPRIIAQTTGQLEAMRFERDYWIAEFGVDPMTIAGVHVAVCVGGQSLRDYFVPYDPELGAMLATAAERFFRDHIEPGIMPPPDASEDAKRVLERMHPVARDSLRMPTADEDETVRELIRRRDSIRQLEMQCAQLENDLRAAIGDAVGIEGERYRLRWLNVPGRCAWKELAESLAKRHSESLETLKAAHTSPASRRFELRLKHGTSNDEV